VTPTRDPHDTPGFDRTLGIDGPVPDADYGDQGYYPEHDTAGGERPPVDEFHEAFLEARRSLQQLEEQLPDPLSLTHAIKEMCMTGICCNPLL